jgi:hypothetical protein
MNGSVTQSAKSARICGKQPSASSSLLRVLCGSALAREPLCPLTTTVPHCPLPTPCPFALARIRVTPVPIRCIASMHKTFSIFRAHSNARVANRSSFIVHRCAPLRPPRYSASYYAVQFDLLRASPCRSVSPCYESSLPRFPNPHRWVFVAKPPINPAKTTRKKSTESNAKPKIPSTLRRADFVRTHHAKMTKNAKHNLARLHQPPDRLFPLGSSASSALSSEPGYEGIGAWERGIKTPNAPIPVP